CDVPQVEARPAAEVTTSRSPLGGWLYRHGPAASLSLSANSNVDPLLPSGYHTNVLSLIAVPLAALVSPSCQPRSLQVEASDAFLGAASWRWSRWAHCPQGRWPAAIAGTLDNYPSPSGRIG